MKYFLASLLFLFLIETSSLIGQDLRSDSIDIVHTHLDLDMTQVASKSIAARADLSIYLLEDGDYLKLDLLKLTVDSVTVNGSISPFSHNDTLLEIDISGFLQGQTLDVSVWYQGQPIKDASTWGGFYFDGNYSYNLGVGFDADPHSYGRIWFPCFDNFVEKCSFSYEVETVAGFTAMCNGLLDSSNTTGATWKWYWTLTEPISAYLNSIAVGDYHILSDVFVGISAPTLITIAAKASDTVAAKAQFSNLPFALTAFEKAYGKHRFPRAGFNLVPFSGGAMEHATNIAFPRAAITGSRANQSLMAHELAHHWWGNNVTCSTAEDMWLNEGWASYSEHIYNEEVFGADDYDSTIKANHLLCLGRAHINDGEHLAIAGIGHANTYSTHVYKKGADMIHTLRKSYMGDVLFFQCISDWMEDKKYGTANTADFEQYLSNCSGKDLSAFFDGWVTNPGFPHLSLDSAKVYNVEDGKFDTKVWIRQRHYGPGDYVSNIPLHMVSVGNHPDFTVKDHYLDVQGRCQVDTFGQATSTDLIILDPNNYLSDATTQENLLVDDLGAYDFGEGHFTMNVKSFDKPRLVNVAHHWVAPDRTDNLPAGLILSDRHYWTIHFTDKALENGFINADGVLKYDGSLIDYRLDRELISGTEDSLVLMYREDAGSDWEEYAHYDLDIKFTAINKLGEMQLSKVAWGEYCFAYRDKSRTDTLVNDQPGTCQLGLGIKPIENKSKLVKVFPNPAKEFVTFSWDQKNRVKEIQIFDSLGKKMEIGKLSYGGGQSKVSTRNYPAGLYRVQISIEGKKAKEELAFVIQ